jgi:hypothetical protein
MLCRRLYKMVNLLFPSLIRIEHYTITNFLSSRMILFSFQPNDLALKPIRLGCFDY